MEIVTGLHPSNKVFPMQLKIIFQCFLCAFCVNTLSAQTDLIPFRKGNLWGFSKPDKTIVSPCQYDEVRFFVNHKALIRKGLLYGLVDETGREIYPCKSYIPIIYHCGRAKVAKKIATLPHDAHTGHGRVLTKIFNEYGFIDEKGTEIIPCIYHEANDFHENYAFVSNEGTYKWSVPRDLGFETPHLIYVGKGGFIDKSGKPIGDLELPAGLPFPVFQNGLAILQKGQQFGIINTQNQVIAPFTYNQLIFKEGGFLTNIRDKYGWLDAKGAEILPTIYETVVRSYPHLTAKLNQKFGLFDSTGHQLLPFNYEQPFDFQEDRTLLVENGKYGFADLQGQIIVKPQYVKMEPFKNGKTYVSSCYHSFWFDKKGHYILENQQLYTDFCESGQLGIKTKTHKIVLPLAVYDQFHILDNRYAMFRQNNKGALYDMQNEKLMVPLDSLFIYYLASKDAQTVVFPIYKNRLYGFLNGQGNLIAPCEYELPYSHRRLDKPILEESDLKMQKEGAFEMILLQKDKKYGALDAKTGKIMISFSYDKPFRFINGKALVHKKDKIGIIDCSENILLPIQYTFAEDDQDSLTFREGLAALCKGQKVGFMDSTYQEVIPFEYQRTTFKNTFFSDGLAAVVQRDKYSQDKFGFINRQNQLIVPFTYVAVHPFEGGRARVYAEGKTQFMDTTGKPITDWIVGGATAFKHQVSIVTVFGNIQHLINLKGERISEDYAGMDYWNNDSPYLQVKQRSQDDKKWLYGLLDTTGKIILPVQFENFYLHNKHFYQAYFNDMNVFIAVKTGQMVYATSLHPVAPNSDLYLIQHSGMSGMGLIDSFGKEVHPLLPNTTIQVFENRLWVHQNTVTEHLSGLLDWNGRVVLPCIYSMILDQDTDKNAPLMIQDKAGKWGFVDSKTYQWIVPCQYESILKVNDFLYMVKNQDVMHYVHRNGTAYFL
jgi:hypothetical protein